MSKKRRWRWWIRRDRTFGCCFIILKRTFPSTVCSSSSPPSSSSPSSPSSTACSTVELSNFPFDAHFLNIQIEYRDMYFFVKKCPQWITRYEKDLPRDVHKPIEQSTADAVKGQWIMKKPWMDLRVERKGYDFRFGLIRMRAQRDPTFRLLNGVMPLFLVISCSFAEMALPTAEYIGDKLSFIVTLLLVCFLHFSSVLLIIFTVRILL